LNIHKIDSNQIIVLRQQGYSCRQIARELGCSKTLVANVIQKDLFVCRIRILLDKLVKSGLVVADFSKDELIALNVLQDFVDNGEMREKCE
jgi:AraC-like DNA-binding protein